MLFERRLSTGDEREIWVRDLQRSTETKLTFGGSAKMPAWSPDGRRFACVLTRPQAGSIVLVGSADGLGARDSIAAPAGAVPMLTQWSPYGSRLVVVSSDFSTVSWANPDSLPRTLRPIPGFSGMAGQSTISPDGRWLAYTSTEGGGRPQVYVQSLSGTPGRWQISTGTGYLPMWTRGGSELLYESAEGILAVEIDTRSGFHAGTPVRLFPVPIAGGVDARYWTCSEDASRFFVLVPPRSMANGEIEVVTDFASLVNRR